MTKNKHFAKKQNIDRSLHSKNFFLLKFVAKLFKFFATLGIWIVFATAILWTLCALGWFLMGTFWIKELFIPKSVSSTTVTIFAVLIWAAVLMAITLLWSKYNYFRYFRHNKRKLLPLKTDITLLDWKEILWDNSKVFFIQLDGKNDNIGDKSAVLESVPCEMGTQTSSTSMVLNKPIRNKNHEVVVRAGEKLTQEDLMEAYRSGYYVQLVSALSNQIEPEKKDEII